MALHFASRSALDWAPPRLGLPVCLNLEPVSNRLASHRGLTVFLSREVPQRARLLWEAKGEVVVRHVLRSDPYLAFDSVAREGASRGRQPAKEGFTEWGQRQDNGSAGQTIDERQSSSVSCCRPRLHGLHRVSQLDVECFEDAVNKNLLNPRCHTLHPV